MNDTTTPDRPAVQAPAVVRLAELDVCALPDGHELYSLYVLKLRPLTGGWAITRAGGRCLGRDGAWEFGVQQGDSDDAWLAAHRFTLVEALERAVEAAEQLQVRGRTAAQVRAEEGDLADVRGDAAAAVRDLAQAWECARRRPHPSPRTQGCT